MTGPVTSQIEALFLSHGLDPLKHQALVTALMQMTWDKVEQEMGALLDEVKSCYGHGGGH